MSELHQTLAAIWAARRPSLTADQIRLEVVLASLPHNRKEDAALAMFRASEAGNVTGAELKLADCQSAIGKLRDGGWDIETYRDKRRAVYVIRGRSEVLAAAREAKRAKRRGVFADRVHPTIVANLGSP